MKSPNTKLSRRSLAQQVTDAPIEYIVTAGEPLPSSAKLSQRFGVSMMVIREALVALAGRGVITQSQGCESVVIPSNADLSHGALSQWLHPVELLHFAKGDDAETSQNAVADVPPAVRISRRIEMSASK